jgi:hypothetical protein
MKRIVTKIGDIFCAKLDDSSKKYFQYIANDMTMLNSSVIRVFKKTYNINDNPKLEDIVNDPIDFYVHVVLRWGIDMGLWEKIGKNNYTSEINVLFRDSDDCGDPSIKISSNWKVWKINQPFQYVGRLKGKYKEAEIGLVVSPINIVDRMKTGEYHFVYPDFE